MKSGKKLIALFLGIVMVMGLLPMTAFAEGESTSVTAEDTGTTEVTTKPEIKWERTKELVYSKTGLEGLYAGAKTAYENITWTSGYEDGRPEKANYVLDWDSISALTTDSSMTVWDYGTENQYTNKTTSKSDGTSDGISIVPQSGISAATWNNRYYQQTGSNAKGAFASADNVDSYTVRKFSGTFEWPEDYDLTSNISILSKNDANYQPIYNYISNSENDDLKKAFDGKKVIAVNDDMYVFIYRDGTELNAENYNDYLAFWTGTAGKGVWSSKDYGPYKGKWGSTWNMTPQPAAYNTTYATPAFQNIVPNIDTLPLEKDQTRKTLEELETGLESKFNHSDGWYSFADGNSVSTVLNNQYANETADSLANQKFHIDIYCVDTDKVGGMDELELQFTKAAPTEASVTVRYWLNTVGTDTTDANYLGATTMTNQAIGSTITLSGGTAVNQLNYKKADAITKNNNSDVADGVQTDTLVVTANSDKNIINVVYVPAGNQIVHLYAGNSTEQYNGKEHIVHDVTIKQDNCADINVLDSETTTNATLGDGTGNVVENITAKEKQTLPGIYDVQFSSSPYVKSNIGISLSNYTVIRHPGKLTITYEPQAATCTYDFGVTNSYNVLEEVEKQAQSITASVDYVTVKDGKVLYTPQSVNTNETVSLTLTYAGGYQCTKKISFYPATNVLYEENFMKNDGTNDNWVTEGTNADTTVRDNDNEDSVYGHTDAYDSFNEFSNNGALKATLNLNGSRRTSTSDAVTFTFKGTGFDLISECGTNTGMLVVGVKDGDGNAVKAYVVDTYFCGDDEIITGSGILDYQVPVVRNMDLPYGTYTVTVYGYLTDMSGASVSAKSSVATQAMSNGKAVDTDTILRDLGMSEYLNTDVSVSFMDDNSVLNGGTGAAVKETKPSGLLDWVKRLFSGRIAVQSAEDSEKTTGNVSVYLDAFRVYQPRNSEEEGYADNEKGLKYGSFYDYVVGSAQDVAGDLDSSMVYMEYDGEQDIAVIKEYKKQGPENEIYLSAGNYVGFVLENYTKGQTVMVSAKAVKGEPQLGYTNSGSENESVNCDLSATEMYYNVTDYVQSCTDEEGNVLYYYLILGNIADADEEDSSVLALSGIKLAKDINPSESEELTKFVKSETSQDEFNPNTFEVNCAKNVKVGKKTAINVKTSLDVDHIAVYFDDALSKEVKKNVSPNNKKAVDRGKAKFYSFNVSVKITEDTNTFYVVAYDSKGIASESVAVTITGTK